MRRPLLNAQILSLVTCAAGLRAAFIRPVRLQAPRRIPFQATGALLGFAGLAQGTLPKMAATVLRSFAADSGEGNGPECLLGAAGSERCRNFEATELE
jgi:hypothetical protein